MGREGGKYRIRVAPPQNQKRIWNCGKFSKEATNQNIDFFEIRGGSGFLVFSNIEMIEICSCISWLAIKCMPRKSKDCLYWFTDACLVVIFPCDTCQRRHVRVRTNVICLGRTNVICLGRTNVWVGQMSG